MKSREKFSGPGPAEIQLRGELDRVRRQLAKLKRANEDSLGAAASSAPDDAMPLAPDDAMPLAPDAAMPPAPDAATPPAPATPDSPAAAAGERALPDPALLKAASGMATRTRRIRELVQEVSELGAERDRLESLYLLEAEANRGRAEKLHRILENICRINSELDPEVLLQRLAETIAGTLGFRIVLIRLLEPAGDMLRACAFSGIEGAARASLEREDVAREDFLSWLKDEFKISQSYFISHTQAFSKRLPAGYTPDLGPRAENEWHEDDVLLVPLFNRSGGLVAYFSLDDPVDRRVPTHETVELLEIFGNHAVVAIENARLYAQLEARTCELEETGRRMQETQALKDNFVSRVSHELRTPLTAIRAYVETLLGAREGDLEPERLRRFLSVVNEESERLTRMIESLLDLNRFDAGQEGRHRESVDVAELIEESLRMLLPVAQTGQIALKIAGRSADTRVDADRDQLRQLVLHLGGNAVKFTPPGGSVTFHLDGDSREVTLRVEDTGIGIPEHALEKIFDRFYQVDSSLVRRFGGSGLGLAICKSIAEGHGGRVFAESQPGRGSCFTVALPRHHQQGTAEVEGFHQAVDGRMPALGRPAETATHDAGR